MPRERKDYSESTAQMIDAEVRKLLAEASDRVRQTLLANRHKLDALAKLLLEQEVVDRSALDLLLSDKVTPLTPGKSTSDTADVSDSRKRNHESEGK